MRIIFNSIKYFFIILCFMIINLLFFINCKNSSERDNLAEHRNSIKKHDKSVLILDGYSGKGATLQKTYSADYSPLTNVILTSVLGNTQEFSNISILYSHSFNFNPESHSKDLLNLSLDAGQFGVSNLYESVDNYYGSLSKEFQTTSPPVSDYLDKSFTKNEAQEIMNYILDPEHPERQQYFFSGDEYEGHETPYRSRGVHLCAGYYIFTLAIYEPNKQTDAWALSKCCFDEPDPILQGLINILENNFISQFEEP